MAKQQKARIVDRLVTVQDAQGRTCSLFISADDVAEAMRAGQSADDAFAALLDNAAENAASERLISLPVQII
jgi:hypothetical protein